jgi:hypothetical protein
MPPSATARMALTPPSSWGHPGATSTRLTSSSLSAREDEGEKGVSSVGRPTRNGCPAASIAEGYKSLGVLRFCPPKLGSPRGEAEARQRPQEDGPATIEGEEGARGQAGRPRRAGQERQQKEAVAA